MSHKFSRVEFKPLTIFNIIAESSFIKVISSSFLSLLPQPVNKGLFFAMVSLRQSNTGFLGLLRRFQEADSDFGKRSMSRFDRFTFILNLALVANVNSKIRKNNVNKFQFGTKNAHKAIHQEVQILLPYS